MSIDLYILDHWQTFWTFNYLSDKLGFLALKVIRPYSRVMLSPWLCLQPFDPQCVCEIKNLSSQIFRNSWVVSGLPPLRHQIERAEWEQTSHIEENRSAILFISLISRLSSGTLQFTCTFSAYLLNHPGQSLSLQLSCWAVELKGQHSSADMLV